jgi:hypothetical protein
MRCGHWVRGLLMGDNNSTLTRHLVHWCAHGWQILLKNNPVEDLADAIDVAALLPRHLGGTCDHVAALAGPDGAAFSWDRMVQVQEGFVRQLVGAQPDGGATTYT